MGPPLKTGPHRRPWRPHGAWPARPWAGFWAQGLLALAAACSCGAAAGNLTQARQTPIQGPLSLAHFVAGQSACYDRNKRLPLAVVDAHLHARPFGGPPLPFPDLLNHLRQSGVLFANLYGIGQRLPVQSRCTNPLDCPGVPLQPTLKSDFSNAQNSLDFEPSDLKLVLSMTFADLARPAEVLPQMAILDKDYPGLFRWMGELNLVKQALFNNGHQAVAIETIAAWKPFMAELRRRRMPLAIHADLGNNQQPFQYLPLMERVLSLYPDNRIIWMHLGLSRELSVIDTRQHVALLESLLDRYPQLSFDLSWRVIDDQVFSDRSQRDRYVALINRWPKRFIPGTDVVATAGSGAMAYRQELAITSGILARVHDEAFRRIALGQNFFELAGLDAVAPPICLAVR